MQYASGDVALTSSANSAERQLGEFGLVDRLEEPDVRVRSIEIDAVGCFVVIDSQDVARLHVAARPFDLAVRMHEQCGSIVMLLVDADARGVTVPPIAGYGGGLGIPYA